MIGFIGKNFRWLFAGAILAFGSSFGQTFFISLFEGQIRGFFQLSYGEWGVIYAVGTLSSAVVMLFAGSLTDRFRARALGALFLLLLAFSCMFMALNPVVWMLPVIIFALRFTGQGMISHISVVAMSRWFVANRGKAIAISTLGYSIGEAFLPMLFIALLSYVMWWKLWIIAAAIALLLAPIIWTLLKEEREPKSEQENQMNLGMQNQHWTRSEMMKHPLFWMLLPSLIGPSAFVTSFFFFQVRFADISNITHLELALVFPVFTLVAILSTIASGIALDSMGTRRLIPFHQIPIALGFLFFSLANSYLGIITGMILMAISTGSYGTLISAFWAEFYGTKNLGSIKSVGMSLMVFGSAIGPATIGYFLDLGSELDQQYFWAALYFFFATSMSMVAMFSLRFHR